MKGIFRMQSRSEIRKRKQEKQRIILGIIILILAILITIITASIISKNTAKEVAAKEPESLAGEFINNEDIQNLEEDANEEIIENIVEENEVAENTVTEEKPKNTSGTRYRLEVNCEQNVVNVYEKDENGEYKDCVKVMLCSVGSATPKSGTYSLKKYGGWEWKGLQGDVFGQYATQITGNILFHSVPYTKRGDNSSLEYWEYDKLGTPASLGCIRLTVKNAKWIYDNCASGTKVYFYKDSNPGPLGKPSERKISGDSEVNGWDPTDPDSDNPWKNYDSTKKNDKENMESDKNNNIENKTENIEQNTEQNTEISDNTENTETNTVIKGNTEESENSQVGSNTTNSEIENNEVANNNEDND